MTDSKNVIGFKRLGDKKRDIFKEFLDTLDPENCGIMMVINHDLEDDEGSFQVITNYDAGIRELIAMGALQDWMMSQVYDVEEE